MVALGIFLFAVALAAYLPGRLLIAGLRLGPSRLEALVLSLAVGLPAGSAAYWICAAVGMRSLYWAWPLGALAASLATWRRLRSSAVPALARPGLSSVWPVLLVAAALVPLWVSPLYRRNLSRGPDGGSSFYGLADVVLHVSLANELTHSVPPQIPFLPGRLASYHYAMDLLAASFTPFGLDTRDLVVRLVPALLTSFAVLAAFCCARAVLGSAAGGALVAFLVMFGEDLSFVLGLLLRSRELWAIHFLGMPSTVSLYLLNPILPAVGFLFVALLCLARYLSSGRRGWIVCLAVVAAALVSFKVFVAVQLLAALGVTACVYGLLHRRFLALHALAAVLAVVAPQLWGMWFRNADRVGVFVDPWPYVPAAFVRAGLGESGFLRLVGAAYGGQWSVLAVGAFAAALLVYLLFAFGARSAGLLAWARGLWPSAGNAFPFLLAVIVLSGPVVSLVLDVGPRGYERRHYYNDAVWFFVVSKHVAWLFAVGAVLRVRRPGVRALALLGLVALSVPSTLQILARWAAEPTPRLSPRTVAMLDFLRREVRPGEVCLATEDVAQAILVSVPCRTLALEVYAHSFVSPQEQEHLRGLRDAFWREWRGEAVPGQARGVRWDILSELAADYVIVVRAREGDAPALAGPGASGLEPRFTNELFSVLRVPRRVAISGKEPQRPRPLGRAEPVVSWQLPSTVLHTGMSRVGSSGR